MPIGIYDHKKQRIILQLRKMSDVEAAWLGAMIDGEGSVWTNGKRFRVQIVNTEPEFLSAALRITGVGSVYCKEYGKVFPHPSSFTGRKPCFQWVVQQMNNARALLERISPFSIKAQAALESVQV